MANKDKIIDKIEKKIDSIEKFHDQKKLVELIEKNNFTNVSYRDLNGGVVAIHSGWKI